MFIFYNGPQCGASAPDHLHFQAGNRGFLPIERDLQTTLDLCRVVAESGWYGAVALEQGTEGAF
jgi:hypothetical protein